MVLGGDWGGPSIKLCYDVWLTAAWNDRQSGATPRVRMADQLQFVTSKTYLIDSFGSHLANEAPHLSSLEINSSHIYMFVSGHVFLHGHSKDLNTMKSQHNLPNI